MLILLQIADMITTIYALKTRVGKEGNSVLNWLFQKIGVITTLSIVKGVFIVFLLWFAAMIPIYVYVLLIIGYVWVVHNNISVIRKGKIGNNNA